MSNREWREPPALHAIAIIRGRLDPETRACLARKEAEGKSRIEVMRCLKRHLARKYYRLLSERSRSTGPPYLNPCRLSGCMKAHRSIAPDP